MLNIRGHAGIPRLERFVLPLLLLITSPPVYSMDEAPPPAGPISLSELTVRSDLVALVQVQDTDYEFTRGFPSGGTAYLKVLIPYKANRTSGGLIEVYEEGLHENECYFDAPTVFEEGRRYLVFLRSSKAFTGQYQGHPNGCALEVFVTHENLYALKFPLTGIQLADDLGSYATEVAFSDGNAYVDDEKISHAVRNDLLARGLLVRFDGRFGYTHGIDLATARTLMGPGALRGTLNPR
jgi:hypothetical protein